MDGVADLGRRAGRCRPGTVPAASAAPQPDDALGEVPVRAALEERERAVREPPHAVQRRRAGSRQAARARAPRPPRRRSRRARRARAARGPPAPRRRPPARVRGGRAAPARAPRRARSRQPARRADARSSSPQPSSRSSTQPMRRRGVPLAGAPLSRARPRRSGGRSHASSRRSTGAAAPLPPLPARRPDLLVLGGRQPLSGVGVGRAEAEAAVRQAEDLVGVRRRAVAACVGDDHDLELEPLRRSGSSAAG